MLLLTTSIESGLFCVQNMPKNALRFVKRLVQAVIFVNFYSTCRTYRFCLFLYLILSLSSVTIYLSKHTSYWKTPHKRSIHLSDFCFLKGSPFDVICDISVNTCEGWVHALNPVCLSDFRRWREGWTLVSYFHTHTRKKLNKERK